MRNYIWGYANKKRLNTTAPRHRPLRLQAGIVGSNIAQRTELQTERHPVQTSLLSVEEQGSET
jgi:hypothetical protein